MPGETDKQLDLLKKLLFEEEYREQAALREEVQSLNATLASKAENKERVEPIIDEKLAEMKKDFPKEFGPVITSTISEQIRNSQDEVIEALYPIMGKLIKKFIVKEFEKLNEKINSQVKGTFSFEGWKRKFKSWRTGVKEEDLIMESLNQASIDQVLVIQKETGLLVGNWAKEETMDEDMFAGMMSAIKSFCQSASSGKDENVGMIEYVTFKILIEDFHSFYVALVISGPLTAELEDRIGDHLLAFAEKKNLFQGNKEVSEQGQKQLSQELASHFKGFETTTQ